MDRALKERIIGAVVLVVIAVLVVPVFLDGPPEEPGMVTESVTLPGQDEQRRQQQTIVLERDRQQPVPTAGGDAPVAAAAAGGARDAEERRAAPPPAASPAQDREEPAPAPVAVAPPAEAEEAAPEREATPPEERQVAAADTERQEPEAAPQEASAASATGLWAVQLGSFSNEQNAERLAGQLRSGGYAAFLSRLQTDNGALHRVRVGPQKDRESAEAVAARLGADGHKGQVVPHP